MNRRTVIAVLLVCCTATVIVGCGGDGKTAGSVGSPAPSLDAPTAEERAAAAREAAKKYGGQK